MMSEIYITMTTTYDLFHDAH